MVTAYPLPEGFTELEVFAIGSALLVEGKLGVGPQHQQGFCPLFLVGGGKEIEANSSTCGTLTELQWLLQLHHQYFW